MVVWQNGGEWDGLWKILTQVVSIYRIYHKFWLVEPMSHTWPINFGHVSPKFFCIGNELFFSSSRFCNFTHSLPNQQGRKNLKLKRRMRKSGARK
jgi:hypothetical protein